jgi:hypothetical protein
MNRAADNGLAVPHTDFPIVILGKMGWPWGVSSCGLGTAQQTGPSRYPVTVWVVIVINCVGEEPLALSKSLQEVFAVDLLKHVAKFLWTKSSLMAVKSSNTSWLICFP